MCIRLCTNVGNSATDTGSDQTSVRGRKHNHTRVYVYAPRPKRRQVKSKVKIMPIIFSDTKVVVHKEFVLTGQTVISAYYCDVLRP
jgi:hypothetical protein